jgi:hypothetical protein
MIESISVTTNKMPERSARSHNRELFLNVGRNLFRRNGAMPRNRDANVIEDVFDLICRQQIGMVNMWFEIAHLLRTFSVDDSFVDAEN